jgi:DNA mismatch endonuclease, patch repair protein
VITQGYFAASHERSNALAEKKDKIDIELLKHTSSVTDVLTEEQRRLNMSRIRAKNTGPELRLRRALVRKAVGGYRLNYDLPGKPDLVFIRKKIAIFVDGCFFHKCPVHFVQPQTRTEFWMNKINGNVERDRKVNAKLKEAGWRVLRFWEHEIRENPEKAALKIAEYLGQENDPSCF